MHKITNEIYSQIIMNELNDENNWYNICSHYTLPEELIEEFKNHVNWYCICSKQKLSMEFIEKYKDYFDYQCWRYISAYQNLSKENKEYLMILRKKMLHNKEK